jgi:hypothetical protein
LANIFVLRDIGNAAQLRVESFVKCPKKFEIVENHFEIFVAKLEKI